MTQREQKLIIYREAVEHAEADLKRKKAELAALLSGDTGKSQKPKEKQKPVSRQEFAAKFKKLVKQKRERREQLISEFSPLIAQKKRDKEAGLKERVPRGRKTLTDEQVRAKYSDEKPIKDFVPEGPPPPFKDHIMEMAKKSRVPMTSREIKRAVALDGNFSEYEMYKKGTTGRLTELVKEGMLKKNEPADGSKYGATYELFKEND